jgi:hypothetical protein
MSGNEPGLRFTSGRVRRTMLQWTWILVSVGIRRHAGKERAARHAGNRSALLHYRLTRAPFGVVSIKHFRSRHQSFPERRSARKIAAMSLKRGRAASSSKVMDRRRRQFGCSSEVAGMFTGSASS